MKPRTIAMISNADQREPPLRQLAPAQSPAPNSRAPYEPPMAPSAVPILSLHVSRERRSKRAAAGACRRLGEAKRRTRGSDVINHYISVSGADLIEREPA